MDSGFEDSGDHGKRSMGSNLDSSINLFIFFFTKTIFLTIFRTFFDFQVINLPLH